MFWEGLPWAGWAGKQHSTQGVCFRIAGSQRRKKLTCSTPLHPTPFLLILQWGGQRSPRGSLTWHFALSQGGAGKERELPFLKPSSVPSPLLATFHLLSCELLPLTLQCPDDTGSQMRKLRLEVVPRVAMTSALTWRFGSINSIWATVQDSARGTSQTA